jgi:hypothetical protein
MMDRMRLTREDMKGKTHAYSSAPMEYESAL